MFHSNYAKSILVLGVLTGILATLNMTLSFGNATYGIGLLLVPVIFNLFFYGLCFLPVAMFGSRAWAASWALVFAVAFLPGLFAHAQHGRMVKNISATDVSVGLEQAPKVLDLVGNLKSRRPSPGTNKTCTWVCQNSLQSGAVDVVRVFDNSATSDGTGIAYRRNETGAIVFTNDTSPADVTLAIYEFREPSEFRMEYGFSDPLGVDVSFIRQLRATSGGYSEQDSAEIVWQRSAYRASRAGALAVFVPNLVGLKNMRNPGGIKIIGAHISTYVSVDDAAHALKLYSDQEAQQYRRHRRSPLEKLENAAALLRSVYGPNANVSPNSASLPAAERMGQTVGPPRHRDAVRG